MQLEIVTEPPGLAIAPPPFVTPLPLMTQLDRDRMPPFKMAPPALPPPPVMVTPEMFTPFKNVMENMENEWLPLMVKAAAPGPAMVVLPELNCKGPEVREMVDGFGKAKTIASLLFALESASRKVPGPESPVLVTVSTLGERRSSKDSSRGRHSGSLRIARRWLGRDCLKRMEFFSPGE